MLILLCEPIFFLHCRRAKKKQDLQLRREVRKKATLKIIGAPQDGSPPSAKEAVRLGGGPEKRRSWSKKVCPGNAVQCAVTVRTNQRVGE